MAAHHHGMLRSISISICGMMFIQWLESCRETHQLEIKVRFSGICKPAELNQKNRNMVRILQQMLLETNPNIYKTHYSCATGRSNRFRMQLE